MDWTDSVTLLADNRQPSCIYSTRAAQNGGTSNHSDATQGCSEPSGTIRAKQSEAFWRHLFPPVIVCRGVRICLAFYAFYLWPIGCYSAMHRRELCGMACPDYSWANIESSLVWDTSCLAELIDYLINVQFLCGKCPIPVTIQYLLPVVVWSKTTTSPQECNKQVGIR